MQNAPSTPARRGPIEGEHVIGADADPQRRPGVPMASREPRRKTERELVEQTRTSKALHRAGLDGPTPVYGTAQTPRGFSGALRRVAYAMPEHLARHWMLLLLADRVDVLEERAGDIAARPLERSGMDRPARLVRQNALPILAGVVAGGWMLKTLRR